MSYVYSQPHKCLKCGFECNAGGSDMLYWKYSPIMENDNPVCPKCWNKFLETLGAEMCCTVSFTKNPSEYEQRYGKK